MGNVPEKDDLLVFKPGEISLPIKIGEGAFGFVLVEDRHVENRLLGNFILNQDLLGMGEKTDKKEEEAYS